MSFLKANTTSKGGSNPPTRESDSSQIVVGKVSAKDKALDDQLRQEIAQMRRDLQSIQNDNILLKRGLDMRDEKIGMIASLSLKSGMILQGLSEETNSHLEYDVYTISKEFEEKITQNIRLNSASMLASAAHQFRRGSNNNFIGSNGNTNNNFSNANSNNNNNNNSNSDNSSSNNQKERARITNNNNFIISEGSNYMIEEVQRDITDIKNRVTKVTGKQESSYIEFKRFQELMNMHVKKVEEESFGGGDLNFDEHDDPEIFEDFSESNEKTTYDNSVASSFLQVSQQQQQQQQQQQNQLNPTDSLASSAPVLPKSKGSKLKSMARSDIEKYIRDAKNSIEIGMEEIYVKRQAFNLEMRKLRQSVEEQLLKFDGSRITDNLKSIDARMNAISLRLMEKMSVQEFESTMQDFMRKSDLTGFQIKVDSMQSAVVKCITSVDSFQDFLKQTDEAILFKASKMDLEILEKELHQAYPSLERLTQETDVIREEFQQVQNQVYNTIKKNSEETQRLAKEYIKSMVACDLKNEVEDALTRFQIPDLERNIERLKLELTQKADVVDFEYLKEEKTGRDSTNKLLQFLGMFHKQFKQSNYSNIMFMKAILEVSEVDTAGSKYTEMLKSIAQLENLFSVASETQLNVYREQRAAAAAANVTASSYGLQTPNSTSQWSISPAKNSSLARAESELVRNPNPLLNIVVSSVQASPSQQSMNSTSHSRKNPHSQQMQMRRLSKATKKPTTLAYTPQGTSSSPVDKFLKLAKSEQQNTQTCPQNRTDGFNNLAYNGKRLTISQGSRRNKSLVKNMSQSFQRDEILHTDESAKHFTRKKPDFNLVVDLDFNFANSPAVYSGGTAPPDSRSSNRKSFENIDLKFYSSTSKSKSHTEV